MIRQIHKQAVFSFLAICAFGMGLTACGDEMAAKDPMESTDPGNVVVYASNGKLQCEAGGITPKDSELKLVREGLDVMRSGCGVMTDRIFPAVCGAPTGEIVLHQIRAVNLDVAERKGYASVETLRSPATGKGYEWVDCETRAVVP